MFCLGPSTHAAATVLALNCEQSELLIYKGYHFFSGIQKNMFPLGYPLRGNFIERDLIGQWLQSVSIGFVAANKTPRLSSTTHLSLLMCVISCLVQAMPCDCGFGASSDVLL